MSYLNARQLRRAKRQQERERAAAHQQVRYMAARGYKVSSRYGDERATLEALGLPPLPLWLRTWRAGFRVVNGVQLAARANAAALLLAGLVLAMVGGVAFELRRLQHKGPTVTQGGTWHYRCTPLHVCRSDGGAP